MENVTIFAVHNVEKWSNMLYESCGVRFSSKFGNFLTLCMKGLNLLETTNLDVFLEIIGFLYIDYICKYNFILFIKYVSLFYNGKRKTRCTYFA